MSGASNALDVLVQSSCWKSARCWVPSPQVLQGQGDLRRLMKGVSAEPLLWHFPFIVQLPRSERNWAVETVGRFFRSYFRSLEVCFPKLKIDFGFIDLACGRDIQSPLGLIRLLKDICLSPLSFSLNKEQLLLPFFGSMRRYLKTALSRQSKRAMIFSNTVLQLKKVCPCVPDSFVLTNLESHEGRMTSYTRQGENFINSILREARDFLIEVKALGFYELDLEKSVSDLSCRGTIEMPSHLGGGFSHYQKFDGNYDREGRFRPLVRYWDSTINGAVTYVAPMLPTYGDLLSDLGSITQLQRKVVALREPLKVRVITVHHASEVNLWAEWQRTMATKFDRTPLITSGKAKLNEHGNYVDFSPSDLSLLRRSLVEVEESFGPAVIVSDDASAATDSIAPELSARVADLTWSANRSRARELFYTSWTGEITYKELKKTVTQSNGQLMGDRRSFPTLCIIHIAAKRAFLKRHRLPEFIRVNGDDGIIVLPRSHVDRYFKYMNELWEINIAKTYVSTRYFSYNSQLWDLTLGSTVPIFRFNMIDSIDKNGQTMVDPRVYNRVRDDAPAWAEDLTWRWFVGEPRWRSELMKYSSKGLNWALPEVCGGLGLRIPGGPEFITPQQKTAVIRAYEGSVDYHVKPSPKMDWGGRRPMYFRVPVRVGQRVKQATPVPRRSKPFVERRGLKPVRLPAVRSWRSVQAEVGALWEAGTHFCLGGDCEICLLLSIEKSTIESPGVSIVHCKSCLHSPDESEKSKF